MILLAFDNNPKQHGFSSFCRHWKKHNEQNEQNMDHQRKFHVPEFRFCFRVRHLSPTATCIGGGGFPHHASSAHFLRYANKCGGTNERHQESNKQTPKESNQNAPVKQERTRTNKHQTSTSVCLPSSAPVFLVVHQFMGGFHFFRFVPP